jgi:hypothetical protein
MIFDDNNPYYVLVLLIRIGGAKNLKHSTEKKQFVHPLYESSAGRPQSQDIKDMHQDKVTRAFPQSWSAIQFFGPSTRKPNGVINLVWSNTI